MSDLDEAFATLHAKLRDAGLPLREPYRPLPQPDATPVRRIRMDADGMTAITDAGSYLWSDVGKQWILVNQPSTPGAGRGQTS